MSSYFEKKLVEQFKEKKTFSRRELYDFYLQFEPDLNEGTFGWRIYNLKKRNIIEQVERGVYTVLTKQQFLPEVSHKLHKIASIVNNNFEEIEYCIWKVDWLSHFSRHQFPINFYILEVEKDFEESVFYLLKDNYFKESFLSPDKSIIERYVMDVTDSIIIKRLISRAPTQPAYYKKSITQIPTIEKMLVDVFVDEHTFYFLQGAEMTGIFEAAIKEYSIDFTKLFSYASRRGKQDELRLFLLNHLRDLVKDYIS